MAVVLLFRAALLPLTMAFSTPSNTERNINYKLVQVRQDAGKDLGGVNVLGLDHYLRHQIYVCCVFINVSCTKYTLIVH